MKTRAYLVVLGTVLLAGSPSIGLAQSNADIDVMKQQLAEVQRQHQVETANLENFDDLDFNVYSNQKWELLGKSHAKDILVHYPDGSTTKGLDPHIAALKPTFAFAPDHKIVDHPIRIASGNWTAVMGTMTGTFTQPMPIGGGKMIPPTGKAFKLNMVTIGRWEGATMAEEWLFWDNQAFMKQLGLAQ
ncbi:MAG: ester cyclase [Nitrospira sp.]|nr:ester cyclase [Nitrospira sp.]